MSKLLDHLADHLAFFSIFGEPDAVAAQAMIDEGLAVWIAPGTIPEGALFDDAGKRARFAIAVRKDLEGDFKARARKARRAAKKG